MVLAAGLPALLPVTLSLLTPPHLPASCSLLLHECARGQLGIRTFALAGLPLPGTLIPIDICRLRPHLQGFNPLPPIGLFSSTIEK